MMPSRFQGVTSSTFPNPMPMPTKHRFHCYDDEGKLVCVCPLGRATDPTKPINSDPEGNR